MLFIYPAIFHKENDNYWVEFPDLEGCHTFGDTLSETMESAQEALSGYLLTTLEENKQLVKPCDLSSIQCDENSFSTLVTCDINQYKDTKAVKKTLTIPSWLNERAMSMGINFSQVLQEALLTKIQAK
ncbi:MAG: type II toxin-antitoxin system HicB family antitoxin [Lachnospiraceae bacterium]|nr:type II toxin-antitoxin system HicB family antitoxin [Lachnospiraceae bacterium]